jgi:hypothetical protein|tara:strand:+ start:1223 stop:1435 length:213 start_codon:yes stop_codon:yes gene_type:complete
MVLNEKSKQQLDKIREKWTYEFGKFQLTVQEDMSFEEFLLWYVDMIDGEYQALISAMERELRKMKGDENE